MKSLKTKISITLDSDMVNMLKKLAEQDDRSLFKLAYGLEKLSH